MIISKGLASEYLVSVFGVLLASNVGANGLKLCIGDMPTDSEIEALTQASSRITSNAAVVIDTTGLTFMLKDAGWPPEYMTKQFPNPTGVSTLAGTIGWAVFYHPTSNVIVIGDVTLSNGPGMVTVNSLDVTVGQPIMVTGISMQIGRAA